MARIRGVEEIVHRVVAYLGDRNDIGTLCISKPMDPTGTCEVYRRKIVKDFEMSKEQMAIATAFVNCFGSVSIKCAAKIRDGKFVPTEVELFLL